MEDIDAIQWVQGAGAGPVSDWGDVMRRIQEGGKALYVYCEPWEVEKILKTVSPRGLMMVVREAQSESEARDLLDIVSRLS